MKEKLLFDPNFNIQQGSEIKVYAWQCRKALIWGNFTPVFVLRVSIAFSTQPCVFKTHKFHASLGAWMFILNHTSPCLKLILPHQYVSQLIIRVKERWVGTTKLTVPQFGKIMWKKPQAEIQSFCKCPLFLQFLWKLFFKLLSDYHFVYEH